jgi:hypothetical protein
MGLIIPSPLVDLGDHIPACEFAFLHPYRLNFYPEEGTSEFLRKAVGNL